MQTTSSLLGITFIPLGVLIAACSSNPEPTEFTNPRFDFAFVQTIAVLPLEDFSEDRKAGVRATRMLITELLASEAVDVVAPGEVQAALDRFPTGGVPPTKEQVLELGKMLQVEAVISGSVTQSEVIRSGTLSVPVVTIDLSMLETETGAPVWAATHTEQGSNVSATVLGTSAESISATTRKCIRVLMDSLIG